MTTTSESKELREIVEKLHEKVAIGWIKNDGKTHTIPSHASGDSCVTDAITAIEAYANAKVDKVLRELVEEKQVMGKINPNTGLRYDVAYVLVEAIQARIRSEK